MNTLSQSEPWYSSWVDRLLIHKKIYNKGQVLFCDTFHQPCTEGPGQLTKGISQRLARALGGTCLCSSFISEAGELCDPRRGTYPSWALVSSFIQWVRVDCCLNPKFYHLKRQQRLLLYGGQRVSRAPSCSNFLPADLPGAGTWRARRTLPSRTPSPPWTCSYIPTDQRHHPCKSL